MKRKFKKQNQHGFALLVVVMIVALISVIALTLLDFLQVDIAITGQNRLSSQASFVADAANIELFDHPSFEGDLPDLANPTVAVVPPAQSYVNRPNASADSAPETYQGQVRLLKHVYVTESAQDITRGLVFELATVGSVNNGDATSEVRTEFMKTVTKGKGDILPQIHAR
jgi:hypothetical protein